MSTSKRTSRKPSRESTDKPTTTSPPTLLTPNSCFRISSRDTLLDQRTSLTKTDPSSYITNKINFIMGYKIRNKSLYYTVDGFKNNHRYKILHDYIPVIPESTNVLAIPIDYLSTIRTL
jgi:hypothetical protein